MLFRWVQAKLAHYRLIAECLLEMARARRALTRRPFEDTAKMLRRPLPSLPAEASPDRGAAEKRQVRQIRGALGSIRRHIPWKPTCLVRAVAAHRVLARRAIASQLVLSVAPASGRTVDAHAWLEAAGLVVTGRDEKERYVPIYIFSNAAPGAVGARDANGVNDAQDVTDPRAERVRPCSL